MTPERWRQIEDLYHAALEREPRDRDLMLAGVEPDLRREVETLLAQGGSLLSHPAWELCDPKPGTKFGVYEILAKLGEGGMGTVYRALDSRLNRQVAIKVMTEAFRGRFQREAHMIAKLNHPNVCTLYDVGPDYLVMELVEGPTLAERIAKGPLPLEEAIGIARQIGGALEAAHEKGIVHRDLKPANVKLAADGSAKVLDFGLAKSPEEKDSPLVTATLTRAGTVVGTPGYMSPEQARGEKVDERTDIWAFGVVLYEMLTAEQPFERRTVTETLAAVLTREPDYAKTPVKVRRLLRRCLEKDLKQRLRDIGDAPWMMDEPLAEEPAAHIEPARNKWLWPALAGISLLAFAGVSAIHFRERPPDPPKPVRLQFVPDKVTIGPSYLFTLSPDGTKLAYYAAGGDGVLRLWVRAMDTLESRPLSATDLIANFPIFWSYDSRFLLFQSGRKLVKIDVAGGPAQTLCDISGFAVGGSSNRDGTILFGSSTGPVMRVSSEGGTATPVTALDAARRESRHIGPVFLPDGRHFLYVRGGKPESTGVYLGSLDAKPEHQAATRLLATGATMDFVPFEDGRSGEILFLHQGTLSAQQFDLRRLELSGQAVPIAEQVGAYLSAGRFSASRTGALVYRTGGAAGLNKLAWFDRKGTILGTPTDAFYGSQTLRLSPDGSRAVVRHPEASGSNLWLANLARGGRTRFTYSKAGVDDYPAWSPDGTKIAFSSTRGGHADLYQRASNGAGEDELLLKSERDKYPWDWSRDGRFLLFHETNPMGGTDLAVLPMDSQGRRKSVLFLSSEFFSVNARFSPDGRWVAYTSNESGSYEIYVRPFPAPEGGGGKWMVSQGGGVYPAWRRDGKELFYLRQDGELMAADVSANGAAFQSGIPRLLFKAAFGAGWDVDSDGTKFLFAIGGEEAAQSPFTVVLNWTSLLRR